MVSEGFDMTGIIVPDLYKQIWDMENKDFYRKRRLSKDDVSVWIKRISM